jgi:hypothetical protein
MILIQLFLGSKATFFTYLGKSDGGGILSAQNVSLLVPGETNAIKLGLECCGFCRANGPDC